MDGAEGGAVDEEGEPEVPVSLVTGAEDEEGFWGVAPSY